MPQKTNLNISPYYDDFDKAKNFYKVLFKPGSPVQARELTGLQSILQNQVESFGKHVFKEGSMVIPGGIEYDTSYFSCKINPNHLGLDVSIYLDSLIAKNNGKGVRVRGQNSGIVATIKNYVLPPNEGVTEPTIFVKYNESGTDTLSTLFPDGEVLILEESVTYGNTTLNAGETILTLSLENASTTGSAFGVNEGVYFIRGTFVDVSTSLIILDPYNNNPSYRVGFDIIEEVVNANDDSSLFDNAKGFTNFAAPGADRFKITLKLAKKSINDFNDTSFVELFKVDQGVTKKLQDDSVYSQIKKYFAKRTFDESGNYAVEPFRVNLQNSLNDEIESNGLYNEDQLTDDGNKPSEDTMCVKLSPGKAYVKGYDVYLNGTTVIDVDKPRDVKEVPSASVPFSMGSLLRVNNVQGTPYINLGGNNTNIIGLYNQRRSGSTSLPTGLKIGEARVYSFGVSDSAYENASSEFDLHLYDIQTYTTLKITNLVGSQPKGTRVRGLSSGAIGYLAEISGTSASDEINVSETTGTFIVGEQLIYNEKTTDTKSSVVKINAYNVFDIKSVFQDISTISGSGLVSDFIADSVLYDRVLPGFSPSDQLSVTATGGATNTATVAGRNFAGKVGLTTDSVISYNSNDFTDPVYNRVTDITNSGKTLTLVEVPDVTDVNEGDTITSGTTSGAFRVRVPLISNIDDAGLYTRLPRRNISNLNSSNSNLIITTQITGKTSSGNTLSLTSQDALDASAGITSAFFEPFDAEKYTITYNNGLIEPLSADKVSITNDGNDITFTGLEFNLPCTVNVTLKKVGVTSKSKNYIRSKQLEITRTTGASADSSLTKSDSYGLRIEDEEISLNVPDVNKIIGIYESKSTSKPVYDKLKFVSGLNLDTVSVVGEKIIGQESRAVGQIVERTATDVSFVYLNANRFTVGESIKFNESSIISTVFEVVNGNYVDRTDNYLLDKGHTKQISDYSRIVRKETSAIPAKRLLVIFDQYEVPSGNKGDLFTVNSFTSDRYSKDIAYVTGDRATDILDSRPRVKEFNPATSGSPFSFANREFEETNPFVITPNESSILGYSFYLPRIDRLVIDEYEQVKLIKGESAESPVPPTEVGNAMEIAQITLPPYLYDVVQEPQIRMFDNRRFTMRDIGALEKRIANLEEFTSLSALELDTKTLEVKDADGLNRFKTGFVVNNFKNRSFIDFSNDGGSRCDVNVETRELISAVDFWSMRAELALNPNIDLASADLNSNLQLLDTNCKKTGDLITLDYTEIDWINQPQATRVENVNPFNVITFAGGILLDPPSDNWSRTVYLDNYRVESTGNTWAEQANVINTTVVNEDINNVQKVTDQYPWLRVDTVQVNKQTLKDERQFTNYLVGEAEERDYVESAKIDSKVDPYMRSRNVYFSANGLKPSTKHFHYLDSQSPDIVPKLIEIEMISGSFSVFEDARIELVSLGDDPQIGYVRIQKPNHKFGDTSRPDVGAGLGSPSVLVEEYTVDPYDSSRPAPSNTYSATSKLLNIDVSSLATEEKYFGYAVKGAMVIGETSGAVAKITSIDLVSDNWGDIIGSFFFRDANKTPRPPKTFRSGAKTFRVTAAAEGAIQLTGSTSLASDASGVFTGTGVIITQTNNNVQIRNPAAPPQRANSFTERINVKETIIDTKFVKAPHRDPLAQSFRVDETGAFLTSFDVYFASKDPNAKVFVELRHMELGTPTEFLVQNYTQVALNPNQVNVSDDASVPTTISFPSPVYLEPDKEYAIVFLSPASDLYEMWVARMGERTVRPTTLPDVEDVVVSKQYIGGSLFKSQNGTIWTPSQYEDLTFKLRKASFVESGTTTFYNTPINPGNLNCQKLSTNPIRSLPRKLKIGISGNDCIDANLGIGDKITMADATNSIVDGVNSNDDNSITGIIEGQGSSISSSTSTSIVSRGSGYPVTGAPIADVPLKSLTGSGTGAVASITVATINGVAGAINAITLSTLGTGYQVGDVLTIDNANDSDITSGAGFKCTVSAINTQFDTLFLTNVQGSQFTTNRKLVKYTNGNTTPKSLITNSQVLSSTVNGEVFTGDVFEVSQFNHAHHGANNKVLVKNVKPDTLKVQTTSTIASDATEVEIVDSTPFTSFNGITTTTGSALIGSELVTYSIPAGVSGKLNIVRGQFNTTPTSHDAGTDIQTYESGGISLTGINTSFDITTFDDGIDKYYLKVDVLGLDANRTGDKLICFTDEKAFGGKNVQISQNHQFSTINPQFNVITPGKSTNVNSSLRTVSGTSSGGSEVSFIDQGFEPVTLNRTAFLPTPRLVSSVINETERLTTLPKNKSLTLNVNMSSSDSNLSPVLDVKNATFILGRNKINDPVGVENYANDEKTKALRGDPHGSVFISELVTLKNPATSLKVLVAASRQPEADFRVYYRLFSFDSSGISQTYRPFPGYKNMTDTTGDGFGDQIIDSSMNDGRPDAFVPADNIGEFTEYQFSVDDLEEFNGFKIKIVMSSTNESVPIKLKDFRTIALA